MEKDFILEEIEKYSKLLKDETDRLFMLHNVGIEFDKIEKQTERISKLSLILNNLNQIKEVL